MIIVIVHHWCKPGMVDAARHHIDQAGDAMSSAPGFRFRYRIDSLDDPAKVSTLTAWDEQADFDRFRAGRPATNVNDPAVPFGRVEREIFSAQTAHGNLSGRHGTIAS